MSGLKLTCDDENISDINFSELAQAVYKTLKQKINLSAELCFCGEEEIRRLNKDKRGVDSVTDVLSFPSLDATAGEIIKKRNYPFDLSDDGKSVFIGSIMICTERAKQQADEYGHGLKREICYLTVHGLLHLCGYDHMTDEDKAIMREKEECVLATMGIGR